MSGLTVALVGWIKQAQMGMLFLCLFFISQTTSFSNYQAYGVNTSWASEFCPLLGGPAHVEEKEKVKVSLVCALVI